MNLVPAAMLAGLGGVGLYAIGKTAVEQRAITRSGFKKTDEPEGEVSVTDDLIAFAVTMTMFGIIFQNTPALLDQASAWKASLEAGSVPWTR